MSQSAIETETGRLADMTAAVDRAIATIIAHLSSEDELHASGYQNPPYGTARMSRDMKAYLKEHAETYRLTAEDAVKEAKRRYGAKFTAAELIRCVDWENHGVLAADWMDGHAAEYDTGERP